MLDKLLSLSYYSLKSEILVDYSNVLNLTHLELPAELLFSDLISAAYQRMFVFLGCLSNKDQKERDLRLLLSAVLLFGFQKYSARSGVMVVWS